MFDATRERATENRSRDKCPGTTGSPEAAGSKQPEFGLFVAVAAADTGGGAGRSTADSEGRGDKESGKSRRLARLVGCLTHLGVDILRLGECLVDTLLGVGLSEPGLRRYQRREIGALGRWQAASAKIVGKDANENRPQVSHVDHVARN